MDERTALRYPCGKTESMATAFSGGVAVEIAGDENLMNDGLHVQTSILFRVGKGLIRKTSPWSLDVFMAS